MSTLAMRCVTSRRRPVRPRTSAPPRARRRRRPALPRRGESRRVARLAIRVGVRHRRFRRVPGLPSLTPSSRVSTSALVLLLCALCDGSFEAKLDACFSAADVDRIGRLSEAQTVSRFDANAALAVSALASSANPGAPVDAEGSGRRGAEATRRRFRDEPTRPLVASGSARRRARRRRCLRRRRWTRARPGPPGRPRTRAWTSR